MILNYQKIKQCPPHRWFLVISTSSDPLVSRYLGSGTYIFLPTLKCLGLGFCREILRGMKSFASLFWIRKRAKAFKLQINSIFIVQKISWKWRWSKLRQDFVTPLFSRKIQFTDYRRIQILYICPASFSRHFLDDGLIQIQMTFLFRYDSIFRWSMASLPTRQAGDSWPIKFLNFCSSSSSKSPLAFTESKTIFRVCIPLVCHAFWLFWLYCKRSWSRWQCGRHGCHSESLNVFWNLDELFLSLYSENRSVR